MRKSIVLHPFLFAISPILFLYAYNVDFTVWSEALVPMAIATAVAILLFSALSLILRDKEKAGLSVSLFLFLFFSYGHFSGALDGFRFDVGEFTIGPDGILIPVWGILFAVGAYLIVKARRNLHTVTGFLNIVAASLVVISLVTILSYGMRRITWLDSRSGEAVEANPVDLERADTLPDIYYIILDGYASANALEEIWGYDNHEFIDHLREKGFYIASESRSNYACTFLSLASSLNMEYINYLSDMLGVESKDRYRPYEMIQDSAVMRFLKSRGYKFVHFQSGWGPTASNNNADWDVQCGRVNEFVEVLVRTTMLRPFAADLIAPDKRERVLCTFSRLAEVQHRIEGPSFVFAHIVVPHPPFVFGPNGEPVDAGPNQSRPEIWRRYYLGQLEFVNRKVEVLVDTILSEAETPPIIILQADHGAKSIRERGVPSTRLLTERMGILNAYYLPHNGKDFLYDSITPVNSFRLIFNLYFNTSYDLLEDKIYYSKLARPYDFLDVTDRLIGN